MESSGLNSKFSILRQAKLLNGILHNSEVWSNLKSEDIKMDEFLHRSIFKAHSKTFIEFLHLETGTKPIRIIIASIRLNYLYNILTKPEHELIRRVYEIQKVETSKGDWIELIRDDFELIGETFDENIIKSMNKHKFKKFVRMKIEKAAFNYLEQIKLTHSKVKHIKYDKLKAQPYIQSDEFNDDQICELFALRSRMVGVKGNFSGLYRNNLKCSFGCNENETQEHLLDCNFLVNKLEDKSILAESEYSDLFGNINQQVEITKCYSEILEIRERFIET
jgi:hypothetical protein